MIPNKFKAPIIYTILNPVNVDRPIQELQTALGSLTWLQKVYGRAFQSYKNDVKGKIVVYPEAWQGVEGTKTRDLINVMPNDNLNSQVFFVLDDPTNVVGFTKDNYNQMKATLQIVFWFNLKWIDPSIPYRYTEILKAQAQRAITECIFSPFASISILRIWEGADNVFRGFTIDKVKQQELVHPFGGFRFECELNYQEDCAIGSYLTTDGQTELETDDEDVLVTG